MDDEEQQLRERTLLAALVQQTESLHRDYCGEDGSAASSSLSLRQLVPVHTSLLLLALGQQQQDHEQDRQPEQVQEQPSSVSLSLRQRIQGEDNPRRKLLLVQYCLLSMGGRQDREDPIDGLVSVVLPTMFGFGGGDDDDEQKQQDTTNPHDEGDDDDDETKDEKEKEEGELLEAVLDAVFFCSRSRSDADATNTVDVIDEDRLKICLWAFCLERQRQRPDSFRHAGRVLVRLHEWVVTMNGSGSSSAACTELVLQAVTEQILFGLRGAIAESNNSNSNSPGSSSCWNLSRWLQPVHVDLLPLLLLPNDDDTTMSNNAYLDSIWEFVWGEYSRCISTDGTNSNEGAVLVVTTSVLCSILQQNNSNNYLWPSVSGDEGGTSSAAAAAPSRTTAVLWDLIHRCLSLGIFYVPKKLTWLQESWVKESSAAAEGNNNGSSPIVDEGTSQLLRRRGLFLLGILVDQQQEQQQQQGKSKKNNPRVKQPPPPSSSSMDDKGEKEQARVQLWNKYAACFETIEMETSPHLIDQVWETLALVCSEIEEDADDETTSSRPLLLTPPPMTWKWIKPLLSRAVTSAESPSLRKLCLYRLFKGQAGIILGGDDNDDIAEEEEEEDFGPQKKNKTMNRPARASSGKLGAPLSIVTNDFVLEAVLPAFDTLESSVGSNIHLEDDRKELREDTNALLPDFLDAYLDTLLSANEVKCGEFFAGLWSADIIWRLNRKTTVLVFSSISKSLKEKKLCIPIARGSLETLNHSFHSLFTLGSVILSYRESLLESLATILAHSKPVGQLPPDVILKTLALYPVPDLRDVNGSDWIDDNTTFAGLKQWLSNVGRDKPSWASTVGSTTATAFVDGMLSSSSTSGSPLTGTTASEKELSKAIVIFCALAAGELWPAINKGIAKTPAAMVANIMGPATRQVARALVLLEYGCKFQVISGMGNGDLVVDRKTGQMMPPPPNIEALLGNSVSFILHRVRFLFSSEEGKGLEAKVLSETFADLIGQLHTFHEGFPSSMAISSVVDSIVNENAKVIIEGSLSDLTAAVQRMTMLCAALSAGGVELSSPQLFELVKQTLGLRFTQSNQISSDNRAARSMFEYAKWGSLSLLVPALLDQSKEMDTRTEELLDNLFDVAAESVQAAPAHGVVPLFDCVFIAAKAQFSLDKASDPLSDRSIAYFEKVIGALVDLMDGCRPGPEWAYMLDEICALIFQSGLLLDESRRLERNPDAPAPIRYSFRRFIEMAGRQRPHIADAVLCRAVCGWLKLPGDDDNSAAGIAAIPYRDDITKLLLHKEQRQEDSAVFQGAGLTKQSGDVVVLPEGTDKCSIARGYIMIFLSRLPAVDDALSPRVLSELLHPVILRLLDEVCRLDKGIAMLGSEAFCRKMRGWQALCLLSRFVTAEIVQKVCTKVFEACGEQIHGQIRYFIEVFTIQCARRHPVVFGKALIEEIIRTDLSLQQVSSLMVVAGNLIVGRYRGDFFRQYEKGAEDVASLNLVLSGVIPWLGSTQGFSRAIAQLLTFQLVPLVVDLNVAPKGPGTDDSNWYLRSIYNFLDRNSEMKRLRKKQSHFFEQYDVDEVCTPEAILGVPVDEGGEAFPATMIEALKVTLREVFLESHGRSAPTWKQVEAAASAQQPSPDSQSEEEGEVNFQRKIIPVDALNLALEDIQQRRTRNKAGRRKQPLIVCATFVDKVPNLGGLARTSEVFAAERLVVPDLKVANMDNFKNLSVGAGDWIDIEECKEENLLAWLRDRRTEGYYIVGLEQTSSSVSLLDFAFPADRPVVLLLGKEKEGIPVRYLQAVDQCVEIPQLGIIRSLNVHVSGAIAIWEQTRQRMASGKLQ